MNNFQKSQSEKILSTYSNATDLLEKAHPVGYVNKYNQQKQADGSWKYVGKEKKGSEPNTSSDGVKEPKNAESFIERGLKHPIKQLSEKKQKLTRNRGSEWNNAKMLLNILKKPMPSFMDKDSYGRPILFKRQLSAEKGKEFQQIAEKYGIKAEYNPRTKGLHIEPDTSSNYLIKPMYRETLNSEGRWESVLKDEYK